MVHYGKHIIDPGTGLCEICDRGAIHDFRQGKRPGRQFLYSNQDGKFTYRPNDEDGRYYSNEETTTTPRYVRKPLYPEPSPTRTRPVVHEEPVVVKKKTPRRDYSPEDDDQYPPHARPTTFYYVDNSGQMIPTNEGPSEEPRRRYRVQNHNQHHQSPRATHQTRVVQRRAQTPPPPPASETWRSRSKRQNNSDIQIIKKPYESNDPYYDQSPRKVEMYHIEHNGSDTHYPTISSTVQGPYDPSRKQRHLEPIERKQHTEPEPTVIRKVYKKLPAKKYQPQEEEYIPNGHHVQPVRKVEKIYPSPRKHDISPQMTNKYIRSPISTHYPDVYHIQSTDQY